jgi:hypothetical protein
VREYCWPLSEAIPAISCDVCVVRCPQQLHCGAPGPSASPEVPSSMEAASPTRAAAALGARREEQPQPSTSSQAHTERPFAPAKAEPISRDAQKALADTVVAFCKSYSLFNQDQMRCAPVLQPEDTRQLLGLCPAQSSGTALMPSQRLPFCVSSGGVPADVWSALALIMQYLCWYRQH